MPALDLPGGPGAGRRVCVPKKIIGEHMVITDHMREAMNTLNVSIAEGKKNLDLCG